MAVFDIVSEGIECDLVGGKFHLGSAPQAAGVVDDTHGAQRGSILCAHRPNPERVERRDGTGKQSRGAIIRLCGAQPDKCGIDAAFGQGNCGGEAGRPASDHDGGTVIGAFVWHSGAWPGSALTAVARSGGPGNHAALLRYRLVAQYAMPKSK